jgi:ubiquinone/menaquinone biosynthesis C-methylase UbiE
MAKVHKYTASFIKKFKTPSISNEYLRKPFLLNLIGNVKNKKILEMGCGNGYWLRILAKKGAKCTGIDRSEKQIELANRIEKESGLGIHYFRMDADNLKGIKSNSFDGIILMRILLEIKSLSKIKQIFKEANRVLKNEGFIIISDLHPFAPNLNFKNLVPPKNYFYFKSGVTMKACSAQLGGKKIDYNDVHHTLQNLCNALTSENFCIKKIIEPRPTKNIVKKCPILKEREKGPMDIMIEGIKH